MGVIRIPRATTSERTGITPDVGELIYDTDLDAVFQGDGATLGGTSIGGVADHGALTGLSDDDHSQYHNDTRGDARYSPLGHNHDAAYSALGHNHDGSYSALGHNHDGSYSALGHNHDGSYSALGHDHDLDYAALGHDHDLDYAGLVHTHEGDTIDATGIAATWVLTADGAGNAAWAASISGVTDHGALTGLGDDDHSQYHNDTRGDARYSQLGHNHDASYSALGHNHDASYAALGHTHEGNTIDSTGVADGWVLTSDGADGAVWEAPVTGVTDHGALTGLGDDDHSQYHNDTRGDARYSQLGHNHDASYSALGHNHDASYSALGHNHDASYSALGHTHEGADLDATTITDGYVLTADGAGNSVWEAIPAQDHGALGGLGDDDHTQYHNDTRGDARYSQLGHNHDASYSPLGHTHEGTAIDATGVTDSYVLTADGAGNSVWEQVSLTTGVTGDLPYANLAPSTAASRLLGRGSAAGAGDWQEMTASSPLSISGTALTFGTQAANTVFSGPTSGGDATPTFRALVAADHGSGTANAQAILKGDLVWEPLTFFKSITIEAPTTAEDLGLFYADKAITIIQVNGVVVGTTSPSVTFQLRHEPSRAATGNAVFGSAQTINSTTTGNEFTSFSDATVPASSWVWLETTATTGDVTNVTITLEYTVD